MKEGATEVGCKELQEPYLKCALVLVEYAQYIQNCLKQLHPDGELGEFIANPDLQYTDEFGSETKPK